MADRFEKFGESLTSPPQKAFAVTPDDNTDLQFVTKAINVTTTGAVRLETDGGDTVTLHVAAGIVFPVRAKKVFATGTAATGIVGLH